MIASPKSSQAKKTKTAPVQKVQLKAWPKIDIQEITPVCEAMLKVVADEDNDGVFHSPVLETYPDLAESYLSIVKEPMDLRTIGEERVHHYQSIRELQDDLVVMLKNCCDFNGPSSQMGQYSL